MNIKVKLAINGGQPEIAIPGEHFKWPIITQNDINEVVEHLKTNQLSYYRIDGIIQEFENEFAKIHNCKYAISSSSGTSAILAAFFSLNLSIGSEVIAPAYTHLATVFPMLHLGLIPVLCDIDIETGNLDPNLIEDKITKDTKAIIVTHQYGHIADMENICRIAKKHQLKIIEDCSHAHGASFNGKMAGTFGDVACFSLQSHKVVCGGEGGILLTNNSEIADRASLYGHFRQERDFTQESSLDFIDSGFGLKNRLHPLSAVIAFEQLKRLNEIISRRAENYSLFESEMNQVAGISLINTHELANRGGYFRFIVRYNAAVVNNLPIEKYINAVKAEGVTQIMAGNLAKPVHHFNFFKKGKSEFYPTFLKEILNEKKDKLMYNEGDFPMAELFSNTTIQFPPFTEPSEHIIKGYALAMKKVSDYYKKLNF